MNLVVTASRDWTDYGLLAKTLDNLTSKLDRKKLTIYVGDAIGGDASVRRWCFERRVACKVFHADWSQGKSAGPRRNAEMVSEAGPKAVCVGFHKNNSPGTRHCLEAARRAGLKVRVIRR